MIYVPPQGNTSYAVPFAPGLLVRCFPSTSPVSSPSVSMPLMHLRVFLLEIKLEYLLVSQYFFNLWQEWITISFDHAGPATNADHG